MGFRVRSLSREDLEELTEARSELETLVLRRAIEQNSLEWESEVLALHHRLERIAQAEGGDPDRLRDAWVAAHAAYNNALLSGCRNSRLRLMAESLRDAAELYRRWPVPLGGEHRDIAGEHRGMLRAILDRDADRAIRALDAHIRHQQHADQGSRSGGLSPESQPSALTRSGYRSPGAAGQVPPRPVNDGAVPVLR